MYSLPRAAGRYNGPYVFPSFVPEWENLFRSKKDGSMLSETFSCGKYPEF